MPDTRTIKQRLDHIEATLERMLQLMPNEQAKIDQQTAAVQQEDADLTASLQTIATEIASLKQQAPQLDWSKLDAALAAHDANIKAAPTTVG